MEARPAARLLTFSAMKRSTVCSIQSQEEPVRDYNIPSHLQRLYVGLECALLY